MNLVIDWGNSLIKAATFDKHALLNHYFFSTKHDFINFVKGLKFDAVLVSSVNGHPEELTNEIDASVKKISLTNSTPVPIKNLYATPNTLGVDRIAAACGAWKLFPHQASIVIDIGSCINYEFIDADGNYFGGAISPGVNMRFESMHQFTAKLPIAVPTASAKLIGDSTETCLQSGVMNGVLGEIIGFVDSIKKEYPACNVIVCGGDAHFFDSKITNASFIPELVIIGLNSILQFNA